MSEFGTPAFKDRWRKSGFFPAVDLIPLDARGKPKDFRSLNARILRDNIARARKALAKAEAALQRIEQNILPGSVGGKIDQAKLEPNVIALCGWVATAAAEMQGFTYYLSEDGLIKSHRMLVENTGSDTHASRVSP